MQLKPSEIVVLIKHQLEMTWPSEPDVDRVVALADQLKEAVERRDAGKMGTAA
jgi:hypothetical protein